MQKTDFKDVLESSALEFFAVAPVQLEQLMEDFKNRESASYDDMATAMSLLFNAIHQNALWRLIKMLRKASEERVLPDIAEAKVEEILNESVDLLPYLSPWRELSQEVMAAWINADSKTNSFLSRLLFKGTCAKRDKEEIFLLYSRYLHLNQADETEFQRYREHIIASVLEAYDTP